MTRKNKTKWYEGRTARIETDITTFRMLSRMAWIATKLYNTALWHAMKQWQETGKIPSSFDLQKVVLASDYHSFLAANTYQHPAHEVGRSFKGWYTLRKTDKTANPPGFKKKNSLSSFLFTTFGFKIIDDHTMLLTLGKSLKEEFAYPHKRLKIHFTWNAPFPKDGKIKEVVIVPRNGYFELNANIQIPEPQWKTTGQIIAADLGSCNPIVSKDEAGHVDMFRGGAISSSLRYWNKEIARVQREVMGRVKGKQHSPAVYKMRKRRVNQLSQAVHALTKKFTDIAVKRDAKEVVIGDLKGIKKNTSGTHAIRNDGGNQNWQQFPIRRVVNQLGYKLARHGIRLIEIDEWGTSKRRCSMCGCTDRTKIHRVKRGLFRCGNCNTKQHADVNGVGNILARYLHRIGKPVEGSSGCMAQPQVWRWDNHRWSVVA